MRETRAPSEGAGAGRVRFWPVTLIEYLQIAGGLVVLIGGVAGVIEYRTSRAEHRVERTLGQVDRFDGEVYQASQDDVAKLVANAATALGEPSGDPTLSRLPEAQRSRLEADILRKSVYGPSAQLANPTLPTSLAKVIGFFDEISICVARRLCDAPTAHLYFDDYATTLWENFRPIILEERKAARPHLGQGLEQFVSQAGPDR